MHPILLNLGFFKIPTYGVLVALAYISAVFWVKRKISKMPGMTEDKFWTLIYGIFFGAIVGGKILFILVEWNAFRSGELSFFRDFRYGFVFYGGFIGAIAAAIFILKRLKIPFLPSADYFAAALPLGQGIGRWGCLAAGCCYGKPTQLPWGVRLGGSPASVTPPDLWGIPLHPTQLYESAADFSIFLFIAFWLIPRIEKKEVEAGTAFWTYMLAYAFARFLIEFVRGDDRGWSFMSLWVSQWVALGCFLAALIALYKNGVRIRNV